VLFVRCADQALISTTCLICNANVIYSNSRSQHHEMMSMPSSMNKCKALAFLATMERHVPLTEKVHDYLDTTNQSSDWKDMHALLSHELYAFVSKLDYSNNNRRYKTAMIAIIHYGKKRCVHSTRMVRVPNTKEFTSFLPDNQVQHFKDFLYSYMDELQGKLYNS